MSLAAINSTTPDKERHKARGKQRSSDDDDAITDASKAPTTYSTFNDTDEDKARGGGSTQDQSSSQTGPVFTMQEALDQIGFGPFQILMSIFFGLAFMADSMEVMLLSVLSPVLRCVFHLSALEQALLTIVVFGGMLISGAFWGKLGDKIGRKTTLLFASVTCGYFGVLTAFSPVYSWILINRFLVAIGLGGFPQMFTYYSEFLPTTSRSTCIVFMAMIWALGACLEVLLALLTLPLFYWRIFLVITACPVIAFLFLFKFIPESPRHLLAHGRYDEALAILKKVATMNGKELPQGRLYHPCEKVQDSNRIQDLFLPKYLITTILLGFIMAAVNMGYFGTALLTTSLFDKKDGCHGYSKGSGYENWKSCHSFCTTLGKHDYLDLFFTSLGDSPGVLICIFLMSKLSRKLSLALQMLVYTAFMLAINFCAPRRVLVGLFFGARAMTNGAGQGMWVYIAEVYPTSIRAIGMGWGVTLKSGGVILSAFMSHVMLDYSPFLAISSFAAAGLIATVCILLLPYETRNRDMVDTLKETNTR